MAEIRLSDIWRVGEILLKIYTKEILTSPMGDDALCTNFEQCQEQKSNTNVTKWEPCFLPDYCKIKQTKHHFAACFWMRVHFYVSSLLPHTQTAPLRSTCTYTSTTMMTPPRMQRETTEWSMRSSQGWQKTKLSFSIHRKIRKMFLHLHEVPFLAQDGLRLHVFAFSVPLLFLSFSSFAGACAWSTSRSGAETRDSRLPPDGTCAPRYILDRTTRIAAIAARIH